MSEVMQPERLPAAPARNVGRVEDLIEGRAESADGVPTAGRRGEERRIRNARVEVTGHRYAAAAQTGGNIGRHRDTAGLANFGVVSPQAADVMIDVAVGEAQRPT